MSHCTTLGIPLEGVSLDELLSKAEKESLSHLHFLDLLLGAQADARRERAVARVCPVLMLSAYLCCETPTLTPRVWI